MGFAGASPLQRACRSLIAWSMTNEDRQKVRDAFLLMDTNKTGTVTYSEFEKITREQFGFSYDEIGKAFRALDTSHDDEIHYSDFLAGMVCSQVEFHDGLLRETFNRFDTNNSGYIDAEKIAQVLGVTCDDFDTQKLVQETMGENRICYDDWTKLLSTGEPR